MIATNLTLVDAGLVSAVGNLRASMWAWSCRIPHFAERPLTPARASVRVAEASISSPAGLHPRLLALSLTALRDCVNDRSLAETPLIACLPSTARRHDTRTFIEWLELGLGHPLAQGSCLIFGDSGGPSEALRRAAQLCRRPNAQAMIVAADSLVAQALAGAHVELEVVLGEAGVALLVTRSGEARGLGLAPAFHLMDPDPDPSELGVGRARAIVAAAAQAGIGLETIEAEFSDLDGSHASFRDRAFAVARLGVSFDPTLELPGEVMGTLGVAALPAGLALEFELQRVGLNSPRLCVHHSHLEDRHTAVVCQPCEGSRAG